MHRPLSLRRKSRPAQFARLQRAFLRRSGRGPGPGVQQKPSVAPLAKKGQASEARASGHGASQQFLIRGALPAPPPVPGSQWGRGGRPGRSAATKGRGPSAPAHHAPGALSGRLGPTRPRARNIPCVDQPGRGDAAGAVSARREPRRRSGALHRVSGACATGLVWRPRDSLGLEGGVEHSLAPSTEPPPSLAFPSQNCTRVSPLVSLGSSASRAFAGSRSWAASPGLGELALRLHPLGSTCCLRVCGLLAHGAGGAALLYRTLVRCTKLPARSKGLG